MQAETPPPWLVQLKQHREVELARRTALKAACASGDAVAVREVLAQDRGALFYSTEDETGRWASRCSFFFGLLLLLLVVVLVVVVVVVVVVVLVVLVLFWVVVVVGGGGVGSSAPWINMRLVSVLV